MTINQMRNFLIFLKNEGQGQFNSPSETDSALNAASDDKFNEEKKQFESTGNISDNLSNFKKKAVVTITTGFGPKPADYAIRTNATTTADLNIDIVPESEWQNRIKDPIDPPSVTRPIIAIRDTIEIRPSTGIATFWLYYLRRPATMVFNYAVDGSGQITYASSGSTDCDWPADCHIDIIRRACVYLGIPLDDQGLLRLEAYKKQTES